MRAGILYAMLSGYTAACLEAYRAATDADFLVCSWPAEKNAPFRAEDFCHLGRPLDRSQLGRRELEDELRAFKPHAILVSGWMDPVYTRICRRMKAAGVPVIAGCDTQWKGSLRQRLATLIAPWHVQRFIDVLWVAGERQRQLARRLGFAGTRCWDGFYACDWDRFACKPAGAMPPAPSFLFVGRYVEEKGLRDLVAAYRLYRAEAKNAWPLVCAGRGQLGSLLAEVGVEDRGFVQPEGLPQLMRQASVFVLPSRVEPWGVVVQEAAASALPLIVSEACGAGVHLVRDGHNGFVTETGDATSLASALVRMHKLSDADRQEMGRRSFELSKQYTPQRWARTLQDGLARLWPGIIA